MDEAGLVTAVDNGMVDITAQSDEAMESVTITVSQGRGNHHDHTGNDDAH